MWRRRLQNKIKELRKDLSQLESSKGKEVMNARDWQTLERKCSIRLKTLGVVIEELKQGIVAISAKVRRYQERVDRLRQNRMFQNNQRQFYRELNQKGERCDMISQMLWNQKSFVETYGVSMEVDHNRDAKWLKNLQSEGSVTKQEMVDITKGSLKKILGRMPRWKSPASDLVQYFKRLKKVFKSKFNGGNLVQGVNTWTVSLLRYSAAFINRRKCELQAIDRKTRKLCTIYG